MYLKIVTAACLLAVLMGAPAIGQKVPASDPPTDTARATALDVSKLRLDVSKSGIERPLERLVEDATPLVVQPATAGPPVDDQSKMLIESSLEELVDRARDASLGEFAQAVDAGDDNPACQPGLVEWHATFEQACAASSESGKPVMLFQLLGQLDQRFT